MLPIEFKNRMKTLLGDESDAFFAELEERQAVRAFRVNGIKLSVDGFEACDPKINRTAAGFPSGAYYTEEPFPGSLPCHHAGMIYMQDPSAIATVHAVKVKPGMKILDSCSAPGGKTTQLSFLTGDEGVVVANEYETKRCRILQSNVERMGCRNTVVVNLDTAVLAETYPETFDLVLCDAPCSGEGMFRKNSVAIDEWSPENVLMCAERQKEILTNVAKTVAPGGRLVYSTCTFSLEENEMNVDWFLKEFPNFELCETEQGVKEITSDGISFEGCSCDISLTRRFYPHISPGEGQYIAVMKNTATETSVSKTEPKERRKKKGNLPPKHSSSRDMVLTAREFLEENLIEIPQFELTALGEYVYLKPNIHLPAYGVFTAGVCIGSISGKRLIPHHQLFSAYGTAFKRRIELKSADPATNEYLCGMEITADTNETFEDVPCGWAAVLIDGCAVGGGKISGNICKNHYPKGLRNQQKV